jgi:Trypsin
LTCVIQSSIIPKGQREENAMKENTMKTAAKKLLGLLVVLTMFLLAACSQTPTPSDELEPQVLGGTPTTAGEYPWMAQLWYGSVLPRSQFCGGTLVARSWVITTANCIFGSPSNYRVVLGDHRPSLIEGTEQTIAVSRIIVHPSYNPTTYDNNIALMELASPATLNSRVGLAEIADVPSLGTILRVIGWGTLSSADRDALMKLDMPRVQGFYCRGGSAISETMFCAGLGDRGMRLVGNDKGGPIFLPSSPNVVGLASHAIGDYHLFTKLYLYTDWINSYIYPVIFIDLDSCLYEPGLCYWEVPIIPDDCWVCKFDISILREEFYRMRFTLPELGLKPGEFAKAFAFKILTPQGKLIAQGKGNVKEAVLELSTQLPKGKYLLQLDILNQTVAKTIHANNEKYPFKFGFSRVR